MRDATRLIELHELETLQAAGAVLSLVFEGTGGGFLMRIRTRAGDCVLRERRGDIRVFKLAQSALGLAKRLGINAVEFSKIQQWQPGQETIF